MSLSTTVQAPTRTVHAIDRFSFKRTHVRNPPILSDQLAVCHDQKATHLGSVDLGALRDQHSEHARSPSVLPGQPPKMGLQTSRTRYHPWLETHPEDLLLSCLLARRSRLPLRRRGELLHEPREEALALGGAHLIRLAGRAPRASASRAMRSGEVN